MLDGDILIVTVASLPGHAVAVWVGSERTIVVSASNVGQQVTALARMVEHLLAVSAQRDRPLMRRPQGG